MARESILLVEDEHDIRELLKFHLERENLAVEAYVKGEDALAADASDDGEAQASADDLDDQSREM